MVHGGDRPPGLRQSCPLSPIVLFNSYVMGMEVELEKV